MIKARRTHLLICLIACILTGCIEDKDIPIPEETDPLVGYKEISFGVCKPLESLPTFTRSIADDSSISNYTLWVFENDVFKEAIKNTDTFTDTDGVAHNKTRLGSDNTLWVLLKEEYKVVTVMMIANMDVTSPAVGTSRDNALTHLAGQKFSYDGNSDSLMPFFGETKTPFEVKLGADGGVLQLMRAMARVDVNVSSTDGHFKLKDMYAYNVNNNGTICSVTPITQTPAGKKIQGHPTTGTIDTDSVYPLDDDGYYHATVYIPEITDIRNTNGRAGTKSFIIIYGDFLSYTDNEPLSKHFYRWDFINREATPGQGLVYTTLHNIERNHRYIFDVEYIAPTAGSESEAIAVAGDADNVFGESQVRIARITDNEIMSITTDDNVYLGVTADNITATNAESTPGYCWAHFYVVTNNPNGWTIDNLPEGFSVTTDTGTGTSPTSVIVWIDKSKYSSGDEVKMYVFTGRIRKIITITIP